MHRASAPRRSPDPRERAPPVVVSVGFAVAFVALVTLVLAAASAPAVVGAFAAGALTALVVHVVRTRVAADRRPEFPPGDPNCPPA